MRQQKIEKPAPQIPQGLRQQKIDRPVAKPQAVVIDTREPKVPDVKPMPIVDPAIANQPVRAVLFVECHDMTDNHVLALISAVAEKYQGNSGGIHYIVPIRHGRVGGDILFEGEFMSVVNKMCEVKDGAIVLKDGAKDVYVVRELV